MRVAPPSHLEVEIGTFCNRRCPWCPNGWSERGQRHDRMPERIWRALLRDLRATRFEGTFAFHNYNEPLADPSLLGRVRQARRAMPHARLSIFTNGDLLDRPMLDRLVRAGVDEMRVTLYPPARRAFEPPDATVIARLLRRLRIGRKGLQVDKERRIERRLRVGRALLVIKVPRIESYCDRAGSVALAQLASRRRRRAGCLYPYLSAAIDFRGNLKLCCHVYETSRPEDRPYVVGNVGETPFSELWASARLDRLRARLARADFRGLPACARCTHRMRPWMIREAKRRRQG
ncbi:MAG: radical SAM/SPASM domain-containing protein [Deltaproteobacteria bacterium]|nr:radical SAM/SPASM domain-containing protein [Deltaproteobacteria bacterium]